MASKNISILLDPKSTPDEKMEVIISLTEQRLKAMIKQDTIPEQLRYIVDEVSLSRFNRIGLEGIYKYSQEGLTEEFNSDDFKPFFDDINSYLEDQQEKKGWIMYKV